MLGATLYLALSFAGISMMANAPAILVGYGFVYASAYYAALAYPPALAAVLFTASHAAAVLVIIQTRAAFKLVALASLALRPPVVYAAARLRGRLGAAGSALLLAALEQLLALTVAILYFGDDGIHAGLAIYEILLAPHVYAAYKLSRSRGPVRVLGPAAALAGMASLYFGSVVLPSLPAIAAGLLAPALLLAGGRVVWTRAAAAALAAALAGLALGHSAVSLNASVTLYPFKPSSWGEGRWAQTQPWEGCPASPNVFQGVHDPERLRIIKPCVAVEGVVVGAPSIAGDGDYSFDVKPDPGYRWMLGLGNIILRKGGLHVEVVPGDHYRVLGPVEGGVCPGDRVRVTGVYVADTDHGMWTEVHPAYKIEVVERASSEPWPDCIRGKSPGGVG